MLFSLRHLSTNLIEQLAKQPLLWDAFEEVFGANTAKQELYRSKISKPGKILDFGCATGNTTQAFIDFKYLGVDLDERLIKRAQEKWSDYPNINFMSLDILKNHRIGKFDYILFAGTGHHLSDEVLKKIFISLYKNLKKTGTIHYFDTIKPSTNDKKVVQWLCKIDRGKNMRSKQKSLDIIKELNKYYSILEYSEVKCPKSILPQPSYLYVKLRPNK